MCSQGPRTPPPPRPISGGPSAPQKAGGAPFSGSGRSCRVGPEAGTALLPTRGRSPAPKLFWPRAAVLSLWQLGRKSARPVGPGWSVPGRRASSGPPGWRARCRAPRVVCPSAHRKETCLQGPLFLSPLSGRWRWQEETRGLWCWGLGECGSCTLRGPQGGPSACGTGAPAFNVGGPPSALCPEVPGCSIRIVTGTRVFSFRAFVRGRLQLIMTIP